MNNKKKVKSLLICNSNMFIPTVLTEVLNHPDEHYLVISDTANIHRFFEFVALPNVDYIEYGVKGHFDFIFEKQKLYSKVCKYDIGSVVFFHSEFGEMANWLIVKLSKSIPIFYCKIFDPIPVPPCKNLIKVLKIKIRQKIFWGMDMDVLEHSRAFPSLQKKFFLKIKSKEIEKKEDLSLVSGYVSKKIGLDNLNSRCLFLTGTIVSVGMCTEQQYISIINNVIETMGVDNLISKCHPRFKDLYGKEKDLKQIPSFIPGNLLINNFDYFIGFESTLLVEAALAGKKVISLIELLPTSENVKLRQRSFFDSRLQGKGTILYPKNMDELRRICI